MTADFITSEINRGTVYLIHGDKGDSIIPVEELGSISTGKISQVESKLSEKDRRRVEHIISKYTPYDNLSDIDSIEKLDSVWFGRVILNWSGPYKEKSNAVNALEQITQQLAGSLNASEPVSEPSLVDDDRWGDEPIKAQKSGNKKTRLKNEKDYFEDLKTKTPSPTEDDLIQNIVIEKIGTPRGYVAKLQIANIANGDNIKDTLDKVDTWLERSGKEYRIFLKKAGCIDEYTRYGEVIESWKV